MNKELPHKIARPDFVVDHPTETSYKCRECHARASSSTNMHIPMHYDDDRTWEQWVCAHDWEKVGEGTG